MFHKVSVRQYGIITRGCFGGGALKQSLTEADLRSIEPKWERVLQIRRLVEQMQRSPLEAALQFSLCIERISSRFWGCAPLNILRPICSITPPSHCRTKRSASCWPANAQYIHGCQHGAQQLQARHRSYVPIREQEARPAPDRRVGAPFNRRQDRLAMMPRLGWVALRTPPVPHRLLKLAEDCR